MFRKFLVFIFSSLMLSACGQGDQDTGGLPWWGWLLLILVIVFILWLLFRKRPQEEVKPAIRSMAVEAPPVEESIEPETVQPMVEPIEPEIVQPVVEDDLKIIEGIGPKIESVLKAAGIHSFSQLAGMDVASIGSILSDGGIRLASTESWPEQAQLAAEGEMEKLKALQDQLKGGKRQ